ncbi:MAG: hypothetical protein HOL90_06685 [Candidatus Nitrosopelagicus sp.]|jgi:hypothetical protein|nr:hypothetical protein [Candidatus Nitrosopelagicus sp.]
MNKMVIAGGGVVAAIIVSIAYGASMNPDGDEQRSGGEIWNFRISGEEFNDISTITAGLGVIEGGTYKIGFVPMGDSPAKIKLTIKGKWTESYNVEPSWGTIFSEEFVLEKSLVDTGISKYYTWEYIGQKYVQIPELEGKSPSSDEPIYEIIINRYGNLEGSVSISLTKVDRSI